MSQLRGNLFAGGATLFFALAADQASKAAVIASAGWLAGGVVVFPGFNLVFGRNAGVAFGLLETAPWWALSLLAAGICGWLLQVMATAPRRAEAVAAGLIIGGALGNVADRLRFGAVTDFLDFYIGDTHWPAFNLADTFIFLGVGLLLLAPAFERLRRGRAQ